MKFNLVYSVVWTYLLFILFIIIYCNNYGGQKPIDVIAGEVVKQPHDK